MPRAYRIRKAESTTFFLMLDDFRIRLFCCGSSSILFPVPTVTIGTKPDSAFVLDLFAFCAKLAARFFIAQLRFAIELRTSYRLRSLFG